MKLIALYYLVMNFLAIIITVCDKRFAIKGSWRVSEKTLWAVALLGGAFGMYTVMRIIRHKTKHTSFMILLPLIEIAHLIIIYFASCVLN